VEEQQPVRTEIAVLVHVLVHSYLFLAAIRVYECVYEYESPLSHDIPAHLLTVGGAYPATVELKDWSLLVVYYEEGSGSAVRVRRFRLGEDGLESLPWD